ncbi:MAG: CvpA family protein [Succinivibrionaceae bacterium]|nr:CvpA family protein [Succinivibrionaceae bacterium]
MTLTPLDWAVIGIIAISGLLSLWRGFAKEALSLAAWLGAFWVAGSFCDDLASHLGFIEDQRLRTALSAVALFIATLAVAALVISLILRLLGKSGLSGTDRLLGAVFGILRGILICAALLAAVEVAQQVGILSFLKEREWWQNSLLLPELERIVSWFFSYMGAATAAPSVV